MILFCIAFHKLSHTSHGKAGCSGDGQFGCVDVQGGGSWCTGLFSEPGKPQVNGDAHQAVLMREAAKACPS